MKKILVYFLVFLCAVLTPLSVIAAAAETNTIQKNEIDVLNKLDVKGRLLSESGGKCWTTEYTDNNGYVGTKKYCDDAGDPNAAVDLNNPMTYVGIALLIALTWWLISGGWGRMVDGMI